MQRLRFTIEVHAGGRCVWPPSFKLFIKEKLDNGELTLADVMKECNASQSLVYKWRADVKASRIRTTTVSEDAFFSQVVVEESESVETLSGSATKIWLRGREIEITFACVPESSCQPPPTIRSGHAGAHQGTVTSTAWAATDAPE